VSPTFYFFWEKSPKKPCEKRALDTRQSNRELDPLSSFPLFLMEKPLAKSRSSKVGWFLTKNTDPHLWFCFVERGVDSYRGATDSQCHFFLCVQCADSVAVVCGENIKTIPRKAECAAAAAATNLINKQIPFYFLTSLYRGELEGSVVPSAKSPNSFGSWDCSVFCYSLHL
jgi:hypothetical protein